MMSQILALRGIDTIEKANDFLSPKYIRLPCQFESSVNVVVDAIINKKLIFIHGDYDVDGITATAMLIKTIRFLGGKVAWFIPNRKDGYGLRNYGVELAKNSGASVLLTADCGINSYKEINNAMDSGIKVVVLDHHKPSTLAKTPYIVSGELLPSEHYHSCLSGSGIAFMLSVAVAKKFGCEEMAMGLIDLACLGTLGDIVPLVGINRYIVKNGIESMRESRILGVQSLIKVSKMEVDTMSSTNIPYILTPRINAAGRMADANTALNLLIADDEHVAMALATQIDGLNRQRQDMQDKCLMKAEEDVANRSTVPIVIKGDYPTGIAGIIAGRLSNKYNVPTIVLSESPHTSTIVGSGRSVDGVNLYDGLMACSHLLDKFGGHNAAAGLSLNVSKFKEFATAFDDWFRMYAERTDLSHLHAVVIDAEITASDVNQRLIDDINMIEPYGEGNPRPVFAIRGCKIKSMEKIGEKSNHMRLKMQHECTTFQAFAWHMADDEIFAKDSNGLFDVAFTPESNKWNGAVTVRANIKKIELSEKNVFMLKLKNNDSATDTPAIIEIKKEYTTQMCLF
jgi:single-stranded-DNA-specific exonuclease